MAGAAMMERDESDSGVVQIALKREPDDPLALRASIGGNDAVGFYLVYRGDPLKVLDMLRLMLDFAEKTLPHENDGRPQG